MKLLQIVTMMHIKGHQQVWFIGFLRKKTGSGTIAASKAGVSVTKKFKRRKFYARFKDNI